MLISDQERRLCRLLRDLPAEHNNRYGKEAIQALQKLLFHSLVNNNDQYLSILFNNQIPKERENWILREAQGAADGAEYTEAARGKPCGHIFKSGEATYRCKTCTLDDTCVLCSRCFEASDHLGHMVYVNISPGNSGCCDCGDEEAWRLPVNCAIHSANGSNASGKRKEPAKFPEDLIESIKMTIGRAIDYMCDVISCSPEQLRLHKTEETIRQDEVLSRLTSRWYGEGDEPEKDPEFALILWNDEKHTVHEVENQVARACKAPKAFGLSKARETDDIGRSVVTYSRNPLELLRIANIIENIKITVTIRSARDTFREQMCSTIIEWLVDISGCSVGEDHNILKQTICKEMLKSWRTGSEASNAAVGKRGIDDHELDESAEMREMVIGRIPTENMVVVDLVNSNEDNDSDHENANADDEDSQTVDGDQEDLMELDLDLMSSDPDPDGDFDMRAAGEPEDNLEISEATIAGYPPPPPPPPPPLQSLMGGRTHNRTASRDSGDTLRLTRMSSRANVEVPKTPYSYVRGVHARPPWYWLDQPNPKMVNVPLCEDIRQRVRLDWMILFDLRLWKRARVNLRDLYISTVVTVPEFKRILGLRFAGLYTVLAQLYLIADREPDHSIIYLSLQMLTTPSITKEIVEKGNFLTNLIAILYTFLTTRQVGQPWDVSPNATLAFDAGSVTNRRMYHFFMDLKHLFASECVQEKLRKDERYVLQFLDLIKLPQGICPNVRAVGEHVEYETDAWISASLLTREINRLCRQFTEAFKWRRGEDPVSISKVIRLIAKATIINSVGADRGRFDQAEIKKEMRFKKLNLVSFGAESDRDPLGKDQEQVQYDVVDFVVEKEPISFHHALHYTLSWLIDGAKSMTREQLHSLLEFQLKDLKDSPATKAAIPNFEPETYLIALFDYPLRVCAWLAQMKAGMWVRNGLSLRHQMSTYRGVAQRDLAHHRDIFLLQTAMVICDPTRILASVVDRFGMEDWINGTYIVRKGYEDTQHLDVAEDFVHLMIVLLSDRTSLQPLEDEPNPQAFAIRRDIAHILCFKPLSFSDLCSRLAEKFQDLEEFQDILEEMTNFKAPEGLSDSGTFELKQEFLAEIDPYIAHYTKNQRDEAETAFRTWTSKKIGKPMSEVVYEPKFRPIKSGIFADLSSFTRTLLFTQIIYYSLNYALHAKHPAQNIPTTRIEAFLQVVLHLVLAAVLEDHTDEDDITSDSPMSFVHNCLYKSAGPNQGPHATVFGSLQRLFRIDEYQACHAKIRLILIRMKQKRPRSCARITASMGLPVDLIGTDSPMAISSEDLENKKRQALDRQAKVMAQFQQQQQAFLEQQAFDWGDEEDDDVESIATGYTEEHKQIWKYPSGNCILCQEETNDTRLYGTFAMMMDSSILRQTDLEDPDFIGEVTTTPSSLDRSAEYIRPFGVGGQNRGQIRKLASDGHEVIAERQGLGKGFPSSLCLQGPVSTGCGHIMHYTCFELYYSATQRRQNHQIARNHPERLEFKEFVCPLCKALGNTFMPIIWKGKEEIYPGVLQTDQGFDEWLHSNVGITVSRFHKYAMGEESKSANTRHVELFTHYATRAVIPPLAQRMAQVALFDQSSPISPQQSSRARIPGFFPDEDSLTSPNHTLPSEALATDELFSVYGRIRDTIRKNELASRFPYPPPMSNFPDDLTHSDALARALGFSISATEIAQRGVGSEPGSTLLNKVSPLTLTHLRILSETASSYIAVGALRPSGGNKTNQEFLETHSRQLLQLFGGHPQIYGSDDVPWTKTTSPVPAALAQDSFVLLTECSIYLVPALNLDMHHVIRLCYLLELVKVVLALYCKAGMPSSWPVVPILASKANFSSETLTAFKNFMGCVRSFGDPAGSSIDMSASSPQLLRELCTVVSTYALPFLRKAVILLHVRYGVDFPNTGLVDFEEPETDRLTKALHLPSLTEMFASVGKPEAGVEMSVLQSIVCGWINHWRWMLDTDPFKRMALIGIRPSHPAIFELIGLPKQYDTLIDEMMRRRCPTTGKDLTDPCLCLFCGDIFCSQANCCNKNKLGGCNQHIQK
ncbi:MAG: hypothetical protein Q9187_005837 [Circinaria calcarea]